MMLLISADQLGISDDMVVHRFFKCRLGRLLQIWQDGIQRIELVKIPVVSSRRTWPSRAGMVPVIEPLARPRREVCRRNTLGQPWGTGWNVVQHPVNPSSFRGSGIGRIRIIYDQDQTPGTLGYPCPEKLRRDIVTVASVTRRYRSIIGKR